MGLWSTKLPKGYPNWMLLFTCPHYPAVINMGQCVLHAIQAQIQKANLALRAFPQGNPWRKRVTHKLHRIKKQGVDIPQNGIPILSPAYLLPALGGEAA